MDSSKHFRQSDLWNCTGHSSSSIYASFSRFASLPWKSCHKNELTSWPSISTLMKWSKSDMSFQWTQQWWMAQTFPSSAKKTKQMECKKEKGRGERFTNSILIFSSPLGTIHIVEVCVKKNIYELGFSYIIIQNFLRSNLFFLSYFVIENIFKKYEYKYIFCPYRH